MPKKLKEEQFWKNYFYRVSLIKQSFNLKRLSSSKTSSRNSLNETSKASDNNPSSVKSQKSETEKNFEALDKEGDEVADNDMFISTEMGNAEISADDLQAEMAALGMENDEDWEKELNQELAEYEIVDESGKTTGAQGEGNSGEASQDTTDWEKEVNDMLN